MRDYSKVSPRRWTGDTGRSLRGHLEAQVAVDYLLTCQHANMLGVYYLPIAYLSVDTGLTLEGAWKGLRRAIEVGFCSYDEATEVVWVHNMARDQVGEQLVAKDHRVAGVQREYNSLPNNAFLGAFFDVYGALFLMTGRRSSSPSTSPFQGAPKPLACQEQEQEQESEQEQEGECEGASAPAAPPPPSPPKVTKAEKAPKAKTQCPGLDASPEAVETWLLRWDIPAVTDRVWGGEVLGMLNRSRRDAKGYVNWTAAWNTAAGNAVAWGNVQADPEKCRRSAMATPVQCEATPEAPAAPTARFQAFLARQGAASDEDAATGDLGGLFDQIGVAS
jgi:hypothetical protein